MRKKRVSRRGIKLQTIPKGLVKIAGRRVVRSKGGINPCDTVFQGSLQPSWNTLLEELTAFGKSLR